ncbi:hypothetical protein FEM48_Zijuj08G0132600 [Ziziphus jujuba var. spinosa]|uniref:Uncharacterized protein n=1 Tax=Ziziphus jujuba var. spinosa TaxID=714518 RepID=A0A978UZB4_ZIZJJ|nr:hypothetical protein FEM48_Zijuj08G0132600 [Ziziphus jujuba var. spinosa]
MAKYLPHQWKPRDTIITKRRWTNLWYCKGSPPEPETRLQQTPVESTCATPVVSGCKTLEGWVGWIFHNVAVAFFSSMERFSCINIDTKDDIDDFNYLSDTNDHQHVQDLDV